MTISNYLPPAIYHFILGIAREKHLALKEVELVLLRKVIKEMGFKCKHEVIGFSKETGLPFCKDCYQRMELVKQPVYGPGKKIVKEGKYIELATFLEEDEKLR
jgi:hypothetical protein